MDIFMIIFGLLVGGFGGFARFYFQFQDRDMVNRLKNENTQLKNDLGKVQMEMKEYYQQNLILKDKTTSLLTQNDDYNKIVGELNRYYFHLKNGFEKSKELTETLNVFDKDFENKMSRIGQYIPTISVDTSKLNADNIKIPTNQKFVATSSDTDQNSYDYNNQDQYKQNLSQQVNPTQEEKYDNVSNSKQLLKSDNIPDLNNKKAQDLLKGRVYVSIDDDENKIDQIDEKQTENEFTVSENAIKVDKNFF